MFMFSDGGFVLCPRCFADKLPPLDCKNHDILMEWFIYIPLWAQILLGFFINEDTVKYYCKTEAQRLDYVVKKIKRLFAQYEALMKIRNFKFFGVLQELHTKMLLMGYHDIKTVFQICHATSSTLSLTKAESMMKTEADPNLCHFNAYLKKRPMTYIRDGVQITRRIGMRDCYNYVNLDNLMRLNWHRDPEPGTSRSSQICTLPITVEGVPKDADICRTWHSDKCDHSYPKCSCKTEIPLTKEDFESKILTITAEEQEVLNRFKKLSTWKLGIDWNKMYVWVFKWVNFSHINYLLYKQIY